MYLFDHLIIIEQSQAKLVKNGQSFEWLGIIGQDWATKWCSKNRWGGVGC